MSIPSTVTEAITKEGSQAYNEFMSIRNTFLETYRHNKEYINVIRELASEYNKSEIARKLKLSVSTVHRVCKDNDIKTPGSTWTEDELEHLTIYYKQIPTYQIAKTLGRSECAVRAKAIKLSLTN